MISLKEAVIVEGRYDKIKLSSIIDTPVMETNGFRIFNDRERQSLIRRVALQRGILILTDSDSAGFVIRNFLKGVVPPHCVKHAYIPQLKGKEKRKSEGSKEGFLGVEGVDNRAIIEAISKSGAHILSQNSPKKPSGITKTDLYMLRLSGCENSACLRQKLLKKLDMPPYLTANALLTALNCLYSLEELKSVVSELS